MASQQGKGRLVAVLSRPGAAFAEKLWMCWENGDAVLPVDPGLAPAARDRLFEAFRPSVFLDESGARDLDGGVPVDEEIALVVATSGTTAAPKGAELSHPALKAAARATRQRLGGSGQRWLCCLPLSHIAGLMVLVRSREAGTAAVIHDGFDPEAIRRETDTGLISLVPTALKKLLDAGVELARYSVVLVGGGPLPDDLRRRAAEAQVNLVESYGMTETCGGCVLDGRPVPGVTVRASRGEVLIRGPVLFSGYRLQPDLSEQALVQGWFRTGDLGKIDERGRLQIMGRADEVIITGGVNVSPAEVEAVLMHHPLIVDAAVAGVASEQWGQEVAAAVVAAPGAEPDPAEIREFVAARLSRPAAPKQAVVVSAIPRTATGKIDRGELARLLSGKSVPR